MKRVKTCRFNTEITPETEIFLQGRYGCPLNLSFLRDGSKMSVTLDTNSVVRLQSFLEDYLRDDLTPSTTLTYKPTGRALAIMDGSTFDYIRVFQTEKTVGFGNAETDSYTDLMDKVSALYDIEIPKDAVFIFFDLFDGFINQSIIQRVIRACIVFQVDYLRTANPSRSRGMKLEDIESFTTIDVTRVSRATQSVRILTRAGSFTLNSSDSLEAPSLFDEAVPKTDGTECGRKAVLSLLRDYFANENPRHPFTDDDATCVLNEQGFILARRTVAKYRAMLGIPNSSKRRIR